MTRPERQTILADLRCRLGEDAFARSLLSSGLAALLIKTGTAGLSYLMFVAFARVLPIDDFGRFAFGFSLATALSAVAGLGICTAVLRFWPEYQVSGRADLASGFIRWGWWGTLIGSLATALGLLGLTLLFGRESSGQAAYYGAIGLLLAAMALSEFGASVLRANGSTVLALLPRDISWRVALLLAVWLLSTADFRLGAVSALFLAGALLAGIAAVQSLWTIGMAEGGNAITAAAEARASWLGAAGPMWGAAVLFAMVQQFDVVVIGLFLTPEETGSYFAALRTASLLGLILIAGSMVGAPLIARYYHAKDHAQLARLCNVLSLCISIPTLLGLIFLLVAGRWLLAMFDPSFADAYRLLVILSAGFAFNAICGPIAIFLQMIGRERDYLKMMALSYAATLAAQCVLTPLMGPVGAALPNMLGMVAWNLWALRRLRSELGLDCSIFGLIWKPPPARTARRPA